MERPPAQLEADTVEQPHVQTFLFADLAGFTALTETHGDQRAADLVGEFCDAVRALLAQHEAHEVKAIGDALLLRATRPDQAVRLALAITERIGTRPGFPSVRIGMHTGEAVAREGDWFGTTVNVASRVSDRASAGEVLVTRATRDAAGDALEGIAFRSRGEVRFKNVREAVELFAINRPGTLPVRSLVIDPVCRMAVDPDHPGARVVHRGREVHFCSPACADAFAATPIRYDGRRSRRLELRVSDRTRERGVSFLRRGFERGELSVEELDERVSHALAARTRAELEVVLRDLPSFRRWQVARRRRRILVAMFPPFQLVRLIRRLRHRLSRRRS
jgi:adenylate cyclase